MLTGSSALSGCSTFLYAAAVLWRKMPRSLRKGFEGSGFGVSIENSHSGNVLGLGWQIYGKFRVRICGACFSGYTWFRVKVESGRLGFFLQLDLKAQNSRRQVLSPCYGTALNPKPLNPKH